MSALPPSPARFEQALRAAGSAARIVICDQTARTAEDAAQAVGCAVGRIVKSLIFRDAETGEGWLILVAGDNRVHEKRLGKRLGIKLARADAAFVREATGYAIGGVPPLGHATALRVAMDASLLRHDTVWSAAGGPEAVFEERPAFLRAATGAEMVEVA